MSEAKCALAADCAVSDGLQQGTTSMPNTKCFVDILQQNHCSDNADSGVHKI